MSAVKKIIKKKSQPPKKVGSKVSVQSKTIVRKDPYLERKVTAFDPFGVGSGVAVEVNHAFDELSPRIHEGHQISRYHGRVPVASIGAVSTTVIGGGCLSPAGMTGGVAQVFNLNPIFISPSNAPETRVFSQYTKYRYTKLKLMYQGQLASNSNGGVILGWYGDGALIDGDMTQFVALFQPGCFTTNLWNPIRSVDLTKYVSGEDWFYMDYDASVSASDADYRQSFQGAVFGVWDTLPGLPGVGVTQFYGRLWLEYEIELSGPRYAHDAATLDSLKPLVPALIAAQVTRRRKLLEDAKDRIKSLVKEAEIDPEPLRAPDRGRLPVRLSASSERSSSTDRKSVSR